MGLDYTSVTEVPGSRASAEQIARLYQRYHIGARYSSGKGVLEVACGAGLGLGYLARAARYTVGADYTESLLQVARSHYQNAIPLVRLDAHDLPFRDGSFDVVIMFEAIYYLLRPDLVLAECRRVLRHEGFVVVGTVNREWPDFNPSAFSANYLSGRELSELLKNQGFNVELYGAFPTSDGAVKDRLLSFLKRVAIRLNLIPKTMRGKQVFKRLFFGRLTALPPEVSDGMTQLYPLVRLEQDPVISDYKVLYAVGQVR